MYEILSLQTNHPILAFTGLGCFLWIAAVSAFQLWAWLWAWVDDSEKSKKNALLVFVGTIGIQKTVNLKELVDKTCSSRSQAEDRLIMYYGYERNARLGREVDDRLVPYSVRNPAAVFFAVLTLVYLTVVSVYYIQFSIWIISTVALLYMARFGRRQQKLFNEHVKDKEAHK